MRVLTIVAYRQPVSQAGIESDGNSSDGPIGTLLQGRLIAFDDHRLFTTTPAFLKYLGPRHLADLSPLLELEPICRNPPDSPTDDLANCALLGRSVQPG